MVCLPVVNDLFLLVSGLVETIEDLLASPSSCSLDYFEVYWDTLSCLSSEKTCHKSALVSNLSKFE
jgi:hypothetical protein